MKQLSIITPALALAVSLGTLAAPSEAAADVGIYVGGSVRVRPARRVRPVRRVRVVPARRFVARGSLYGGDLYVGFASQPPPCPADCAAPVPAYYPPSATVVAPAPAPSRFTPSLTLGVFAGGVDLADGDRGQSGGLIARVGLGRHLALEGELSGSEMDNGLRADARVGGAVVLGLLPSYRLNPYLVGGGGMMFTEVGSYRTRAPYAEVGIGLQLGLTRHLSVAIEGRAGARRGQVASDDVVGYSTVSRPAPEDHEEYTRGRIAAMWTF